MAGGGGEEGVGGGLHPIPVEGRGSGGGEQADQGRSPAQPEHPEVEGQATAHGLMDHFMFTKSFIALSRTGWEQADPGRPAPLH